MEPTVFTDVEDHMFIAKEESFGPVMIISKFKNGSVSQRSMRGLLKGGAHIPPNKEKGQECALFRFNLITVAILYSMMQNSLSVWNFNDP